MVYGSIGNPRRPWAHGKRCLTLVLRLGGPRSSPAPWAKYPRLPAGFRAWTGPNPTRIVYRSSVGIPACVWLESNESVSFSWTFHDTKLVSGNQSKPDPVVEFPLFPSDHRRFGATSRRSRKPSGFSESVVWLEAPIVLEDVSCAGLGCAPTSNAELQALFEPSRYGLHGLAVLAARVQPANGLGSYEQRHPNRFRRGELHKHDLSGRKQAVRNLDYNNWNFPRKLITDGNGLAERPCCHGGGNRLTAVYGDIEPRLASGKASYLQ